MGHLPGIQKEVKKVKLGTTVLESTLEGLKALQGKRPDVIRSTGEALDMVAGLMLNIDPTVAMELMDFCSGRAETYARELRGFTIAESDGFAYAEKSRIHGTFSGLADYMKIYCEPGDARAEGMRRIDLKDEDYVIFPGSWVVLNEASAPKSSHVVVIEVRGGSRYGAPHFVYFKERDGWMTDFEKKDALGLAERAWPGMAEVLHDEVPLVYDSDGRPLNEEDHLSAPIVCFFNMLSASDYRRPSDAPYGAMVVRH